MLHPNYLDTDLGPIGRVVTSEENPATAHEFYFWTAETGAARNLDIGHIVAAEAEDATAIHREGGDEVENDERDVHAEQVREEVRAHVLVDHRGDLACGKRVEQQGNADIHERAGDGDEELFGRLFGHALEPGDAADWEQCDVRRLNAVAACGEGVAKLVQEHAEENERDEDDRAEPGAGAGARVVAKADEREEHQEGDVDADVDAGDASEMKRPAHECGKNTREGTGCACVLGDWC